MTLYDVTVDLCVCCGAGVDLPGHCPSSEHDTSDTMLGQCWADVVDGKATLVQHCVMSRVCWTELMAVLGNLITYLLFHAMIAVDKKTLEKWVCSIFVSKRI